MNFLRNFSDTTLYSGYSRAIGIDFSRQRVYFFDPKLVSLLIDSKYCSSIESLSEKEPHLLPLIEELVAKEIVFKTNSPELFPNEFFFEESFSLKETIHVKFIEFDEFILADLKKIINSFQIKAGKFDLRKCSHEFITSIAAYFSDTTFESLEFLVNFNVSSDFIDFAQECTSKNGALLRISIDGLPNDFVFPEVSEVSFCDLDESFPKIVPSQKLFSETLFVNNFFHKKLFVNENGEIQTGENPDKTIGVIGKIGLDSLEEIVLETNGTGLGIIQKDQISVCKDCEFRYICVDNRTPISRSKNDYFFESECPYNPYITKWSHEEGYLTLSECGVISNENEFSIDHNRIAEINFKLWSDE